MTSRINWDAANYARNSQGQFGWAMANLEKLVLRGDETVLDVGCGDGKVSVEIARKIPNGCVVGIDSSQVMIAAAHEKALESQVSNLTFQVMDAQALTFNEEFEAVFSNSAMHWLPNPQAAVQGIARSLKQGGRLVLSMGGRGTAAVVFASLEIMARDPRWQAFIQNVPSPHRFLGPEEYGPWLSAAGLSATRVALVPKPMRHADIAALQGWLRTTWMHYTERVPAESRTAFLIELADRVSQRCPADGEGALLMPMVNLEVEARKTSQ